MSNALPRFADAAKRFQAWALDPPTCELEAATEALRILLHLYAAALELPPQPVLDDSPDDLPGTVDEPEWHAIFAAAAVLPFQYYAEVFNPLVVPPEEPVVGDLADDIADIYRDVVGPLRLYQNGCTQVAHWYWLLHLPHWGEHATSAIRALHRYLTDKDAFWYLGA